MGLSEALSILGQTVTLAVGLQFIGWAKWQARLAEEEWRRRDGPLDANLLPGLRTLVEETKDRLRQASSGLEAAARQLRREVL